MLVGIFARVNSYLQYMWKITSIHWRKPPKGSTNSFATNHTTSVKKNAYYNYLQYRLESWYLFHNHDYIVHLIAFTVGIWFTSMPDCISLDALQSCLEHEKIKVINILIAILIMLSKRNHRKCNFYLACHGMCAGLFSLARDLLFSMKSAVNSGRQFAHTAR